MKPREDIEDGEAEIVSSRYHIYTEEELEENVIIHQMMMMPTRV